MKSGCAMLMFFAFLAVSPASASQANPIEKILEMISDLQAKVIKEGEDAQKDRDVPGPAGPDRVAKKSVPKKACRAGSTKRNVPS